MFQQKVLFAEHGAQPASRCSASVPAPSPSLTLLLPGAGFFWLFVCVSMAFSDHNGEHASCLGSERSEMEKHQS